MRCFRMKGWRVTMPISCRPCRSIRGWPRTHEWAGKLLVATETRYFRNLREVEPFHLFRYLDEQAFRFNNRKATDADRFNMALSDLVAKRVTYQELYGQRFVNTSISHTVTG